MAENPRRSHWIRSLFLALAFVLLPGVGAVALVQGRETIEAVLASDPAIFIAAFLVFGAVLAAAGLMPSHGLAILGGFGFGLPTGLGLTMAAVMIAAALGRLFGPKLLGRSADEGFSAFPRLGRLAEAVREAPPRDAFALVASIRVSPIFPFALTNLVFSGIGLAWRPYLLGSLIGLLPRVGLSVSIGAQLKSFDPSVRGDWWDLSFTLAAAIGGLALSGWIGRKLLARKTGTQDFARN